MNENYIALLNITSQYLLKQKDIYLKRDIKDNRIHYEFSARYIRDNDADYIKNVHLLLEELGQYFSLLKEQLDILPPVITIPKDNLGNLKRNWFRQYLKTNPTQDEMDEAFHAIFQSFGYNTLFNYLSRNIKGTELKFGLQLLNISFNTNKIYHSQQFTSSIFCEALSYANWLGEPRYPKKEVIDALNHLLPYYATVLQDPNQLKFHYKPQYALLDFLKTQLPDENLQPYQNYLFLYITDVKKDISDKLFSTSNSSYFVAQIEHSYISHYYPNLLVSEDIKEMNRTICKYLLTPECSQLGVHDIIFYSNTEDHNEKNTSYTKLLVSGKEGSNLSQDKFFKVYEKAVALYSENFKRQNHMRYTNNTISRNNQLDEDSFKKALFYYIMEEAIENNNSQTRRNKI